MSSHSKALKGKVGNMVVKKFKDSKGVKAKQPYSFLKQIGSKQDSEESKGER